MFQPLHASRGAQATHREHAAVGATTGGDEEKRRRGDDRARDRSSQSVKHRCLMRMFQQNHRGQAPDGASPHGFRQSGNSGRPYDVLEACDSSRHSSQHWSSPPAAAAGWPADSSRRDGWPASSGVGGPSAPSPTGKESLPATRRRSRTALSSSPAAGRPARARRRQGPVPRGASSRALRGPARGGRGRRAIRVVAGHVAHVRVGILRATPAGKAEPGAAAKAAPGEASAHYVRAQGLPCRSRWKSSASRIGLKPTSA